MAMTPIVRMNAQGGAAWPLCGATRTVGNDSVADRNPAVVKWERRYIADEDAVEIYMRPGATGEGYYGWQWSGFAAPTAGATRVLRAKIKVVSPINWGDWGDKFMVVGDVSNDAANRIISTMSLYQGRPHLNVDKNIDGRYAHGFLTPDVYTAIQIVASPTSPGASTYSFKFWVDGVLVRTSVAFTINPAQWRDFNIGYYGQYGSDGHVRIRFKDVEFDDEYDPNYHLGSTPPPPPPCAFTVTPTALSLAAAGGSATVNVAANRDGCTWTASSAIPWLSVSPGTAGATLTAQPNTGVDARVASITVAGTPVTVTQAGTPVVEPPPPPPPDLFSGSVETVYVDGRVTSVRVVPRV